MDLRGKTVADVGEFGLIAALRARLPEGGGVLVGSGDDAALLEVGEGGALVSTDVFVDGRHFRRDWCSATDIGHRAAAQSLSDLNAMGGTTVGLTIGLVLPADLPAEWVLELADGLAVEAAAAGASVVGGDITRGDQVVIAVTAVGRSAVAPVLRGGAREGDLVAFHGRLGWAAGGLAILGRGFRSPRALVDAYRRPDIDYTAGPAALAAGASSLIDVSDGLVADLGHVAAASGVTIDLATSLLLPDEPLQTVGAALGVDPLTFVLTGGDDHALVATYAAGGVPDGWRVIGEVTGTAEAGVTVDGAAYDGPGGYRHF